MISFARIIYNKRLIVLLGFQREKLILRLQEERQMFTDLDSSRWPPFWPGIVRVIGAVNREGHRHAFIYLEFPKAETEQSALLSGIVCPT